ncbi:MAG: hypothetical protein MK100_01210 [Phycisphaerales bacterium]|nr:hypothetical protein [Phycisphaerales bacterium]
MSKIRILILLAAWATIDLGTSAIQAEVRPHEDTERAPRHPSRSALEGVAKLLEFQEDLCSGARPLGANGIRSLYDWGVRTIISVDALPPEDVKEFSGISLVHIPLSYSGPNDAQILDLATAYAMGRSKGKVFVHCHHGIHRAPTACALIGIASGISTQEQAMSRMRDAGTSPHYPMLWRSVKEQEPIHYLDIVNNIKPLPAAVQASDIASSMTRIDEAMTRLDLVHQNQWNVPSSHPDLAPAADAGFIAESLRKLQTRDDWQGLGIDPAQVQSAIDTATQLELLLLAHPQQLDVLSSQFERIAESCTACHAAIQSPVTAKPSINSEMMDYH